MSYNGNPIINTHLLDIPCLPWCQALVYINSKYLDSAYSGLTHFTHIIHLIQTTLQWGRVCPHCAGGAHPVPLHPCWAPIPNYRLPLHMDAFFVLFEFILCHSYSVDTLFPCLGSNDQYRLLLCVNTLLVLLEFPPYTRPSIDSEALTPCSCTYTLSQMWILFNPLGSWFIPWPRPRSQFPRVAHRAQGNTNLRLWVYCMTKIQMNS